VQNLKFLGNLAIYCENGADKFKVAKTNTSFDPFTQSHQPFQTRTSRNWRLVVSLSEA